jgi:hypothetical protein
VRVAGCTGSAGLGAARGRLREGVVVEGVVVRWAVPVPVAGVALAVLSTAR